MIPFRYCTEWSKAHQMELDGWLGDRQTHVSVKTELGVMSENLISIAIYSLTTKLLGLSNALHHWWQNKNDVEDRSVTLTTFPKNYHSFSVKLRKDRKSFRDRKTKEVSSKFDGCRLGCVESVYVILLPKSRIKGCKFNCDTSLN